MIITPLQIRFNDMDPMMRVNNSSYASYLELGRLDFCRQYLKIQELADIPFVLVRLEMDIQQSLRPNMSAAVHTWVSRIGQSSWDFRAEIRSTDQADLVFVSARTVQVYFDYRANKKRAIPPEFRSCLQAELL
ncbi:MAG: acyl-CoA thioesterase [Leptospiraceae bacterium]|nr:acyl-CoA thioesterase [Leptospiraceae bacterium]